MLDCPTCHAHVDGLFCPRCEPQRKDPPPPATMAAIRATLEKCSGRRPGPAPMREPGEEG